METFDKSKFLFHGYGKPKGNSSKGECPDIIMEYSEGNRFHSVSVSIVRDGDAIEYSQYGADARAVSVNQGKAQSFLNRVRETLSELSKKNPDSDRDALVATAANQVVAELLRLQKQGIVG